VFGYQNCPFSSYFIFSETVQYMRAIMTSYLC
jgi:hypothetical protein